MCRHVIMLKPFQVEYDDESNKIFHTDTVYSPRCYGIILKLEHILVTWKLWLFVKEEQYSGKIRNWNG